MNDRASRLQEANKQSNTNVQYTAYAAKEVLEGRKWAQSNTVYLSSPYEARVVQIDGVIHLINLREATCTCGRYQRNGVPCGHAMAAIFRQGLGLDTFLPAILSINQ
jgi:hypothetical protein